METKVLQAYYVADHVMLVNVFVATVVVMCVVTK